MSSVAVGVWPGQHLHFRRQEESVRHECRSSTLRLRPPLQAHSAYWFRAAHTARRDAPDLTRRRGQRQCSEQNLKVIVRTATQIVSLRHRLGDRLFARHPELKRGIPHLRNGDGVPPVRG